MRYVLFVIVCQFIVGDVQGEDWVSRHSAEFGNSLKLSEQAKHAISEEFDKVDVVGLGETSHGVSEFFKLKSAMIKHLVEHKKFSLIAIEATFGETVYLNDFISGKRNNLDAILKGMPLWFFKVDEFRELLVWMREYNAGNDNRVKLYGLEMQYVDRSFDIIMNFLSKVDQEEARKLFKPFGLDRIGNSESSAKEFYSLWQPMSDEVMQAHFTLLLGLRRAFSKSQADYVAKSDQATFDLVRRHLVVVEQFLSAIMQSEEAIKHQMRDYFMFLNLQWIRTYLNNPKTIVWAHNEHIWKQQGNGGYDVLGRQLDRRYGDAYFAIGFDFGAGTYRAPNDTSWEQKVPAPKTGSLSKRMSDSGKHSLFLNIRSAKRANEEIPRVVTMRASSGGYTPKKNGKTIFARKYSLADRYDALIFVNKISLPKLLD